ncbi:aminoacyl-tRNA hydrolase [bacterium]|nr:aminoacyl-tRNA hydrolase [bacterium]|tara:strand:+ start:2407 stop:2829 length:423 start_codon:yes stop_codon:yes gene_type:complete
MTHIDIHTLGEKVEFKASRSHGPGGQNKDHRSTKVHMWVSVDDLPLEPLEKRRLREKLAHHVNKEDELWVEDQETRYQEENREKALERLASMINEAIKEPPVRIPNEPPLSAEDDRIREKKIIGDKKKQRREGHIPQGNA